MIDKRFKSTIARFGTNNEFIGQYDMSLDSYITSNSTEQNPETLNIDAADGRKKERKKKNRSEHHTAWCNGGRKTCGVCPSHGKLSLNRVSGDDNAILSPSPFSCCGFVN
jgi:hypothetical protein